MLYLWLILTLPQNRTVCELWTRELPTQQALVQACGTDALGNYALFATQGGVGVCYQPAASLSTVRQECNLLAPLDSYRFRIVEEGYQTSLCTVSTLTNSAPDWMTITRDCPDAMKYTPATVEIRAWGTRQPDPEPDAVCMPPPPPQPATIATTNDYHILAGKLIWYGLAKGNCPGGYSGLDPVTLAALPCGIAGARAQVYEWQNGLDPYILESSRIWNIPPQLLKQLIADETQFWTWTGVDGEHGMIQITDAGAAVVQHIYYPGYYKLTDAQKWEVRAVWLRKLDCIRCTPVQAYEHAKSVMNYYAQALAAYYCMYGPGWDAALRAWNVRHVH